MSNKSNEFKISTPTWDEKFELSDGSYPLSDIQDHFQYIETKYGELTDIPPQEYI